MVYILSDIHGNMRRFQSILRQIDLQPADRLYILGDVIDRHPDGIRILRQIMAMPNAKMLLGNHEHLMLMALGEGYDKNDSLFPYSQSDWLAIWYRNGGSVTHRHLKYLRKTVRAEIFRYLQNLPLSMDTTVGETNYKLVHAAPPELFSDYADQFRNPTHFALWKRWQKEDQLSKPYTMIFGHTPTRHYQDLCPMEIYRGAGFLCIDCGSGYSESADYEFHAYGRLACLRLDDGKVFYSDN